MTVRGNAGTATNALGTMCAGRTAASLIAQARYIEGPVRRQISHQAFRLITAAVHHHCGIGNRLDSTQHVLDFPGSTRLPPSLT